MFKNYLNSFELFVSIIFSFARAIIILGFDIGLICHGLGLGLGLAVSGHVLELCGLVDINECRLNTGPV